MIYEQPLNETMRLCLRLEHLFHRVGLHADTPMPWQSAFALNHLLELLSVIDRPDVKAKFTKLLSLLIRALLQHSESPESHLYKSDNVAQAIEYLQRFLENLRSHAGRIGQDLYSDSFLRLMRSQLSAPGGACPFSAPEYYLWLQQPDKKRVDNLTGWLEPLKELESMNQWILTMIRQLNQPVSVTAEQGFYQQVLDTKQKGQMVSVVLDSPRALYPVFSVGPHRLSIHFYTPCFEDGVSHKWDEDITCQIAYCAL